MARQERAEHTRNAILDAAAAKFDEYGFLGASLSDILAEAGVTKGALYFHFASKEELANALIAEQFASDHEPLAGVERPGLQTAIDMGHELAANLRANKRVRAGIRLVIEQGSFIAPAESAYRMWIDITRTCLLAARENGDLRAEVDPDDLAQHLVGAFTGLQLSSQVLTGRADLTERVTFMWTLLLTAIVPPRRLARFKPEGTASIRIAGVSA
ncbi:ScbR family autoregulator-binding transcription factor [Actinokineospora auranticolor]|uniref:AcrR family transcriptional regulator n=1 Tax=Actinokineospora auranticolor TaxID=155976 RepID=A0A2S6GJY7_9PSEU|nr:ScbR family autoregulator-binding transcription factor [Actinokineospora auranticolor]PPK65466.1 AcrR family transcriptional regulator [Actinokineospora auranticolor]